ncbi:hypothetical protein QCA50_007714 [Cerrena zonata]|uniref:Epoxide hydrolase N-terminal domain-containing protein n=1 Tax=Cerrena zonata TaxID=2478898 RepID=A0AAW0G6Q9_9APHY
MSLQVDPSQPTAFKVAIPDDEVARMVRLIGDTRLPDQPFVSEASWDYGVDLKWLKEMKDKWLNEFDWKEVERKMNEWEHFKVRIEGVDLHYIHVRSAREDAVPILLSHGWPGSFWEFNRVIEPLTNPPPGQPAFHVVIPSLPGFGFSSSPPKKEWSMGDNARIFDYLMTGVLGYPAYMAQGGDWGAFITSFLGSADFPACKMVNLNMLNGPPSTRALLTLPLLFLPTTWREWIYSKIYTEQELQDLSRSFAFLKSGLGYFLQNNTRPLTIGYVLYDNPVGILAWIGEKYKEHVDPTILPDRLHDILVTVSLYYLSGTAHTSGLPYKENNHLFKEKRHITEPYGISRFPYDIFLNPLSWVTKNNPGEVVLVRRHDRGGHFAALEVPDLLVGDLREMVAGHWKRLV